jgi:formiminoglutamase
MEPLSAWTGRMDPEEGGAPARWHEVVRRVDLANPARFTFVGFPVDEGVRRNLGRPGAGQGPEALRRALSNLSLRGEGALADWGDVDLEGDHLEGAQARLGEAVATLIRGGSTPVVLGGGHETAFGTFLGVHAATPPGDRILVVNVDAHFDVRLGDERGGDAGEGGASTSGTSFRQIHELARAEGRPLQCRMLGISAFSNPESLLLRAHALGIVHHLDEALHEDAGVRAVERELEALSDEVDAIHLSLCLDVLPEAVAPGVSAPSPLGVPLRSVERILDAVSRTGKLRAFDVAELSPPLDRGGQTARAAARLIGRLVRAGSSPPPMAPPRP